MIVSSLVCLLAAILAAASPVAPFRAVRDSVARAPSPATADSAAIAPPSPVRLPRPDTILVLPEVRVDRERPRRTPRAIAPTSFVDVLPARAPGRALASLDQTLAQAAGVHVTEYGGLGAFSTVSVRGAPAAQVAVLVDGEPLQSAARSIVSLADVPAAAVERIDLYRGAAPLEFGTLAPAGAVNLITLPAPGTLEARLAHGSFGAWEGGARGGLARGPLTLAFNAGYQGARGDFRFLDDNGTPLNTADDSVTTRRNDRFDATHAIGSLALDLGARWRADMRADWFRRLEGVPGRGAVQALNASHALERAGTRLALLRRGAGRSPEIRLHAALERERAQFRDLQGELGLGRWRTDDRFAGERAGLDLSWARLPLGLAARAGVDARSERARPTNSADPYPDPPESRRTVTGQTLALELHAPRERGLLFAAQRWDQTNDRLNSLGLAGSVKHLDVPRATRSPRLGARLGVIGGLELRGNWSEAVRLPDFTELFGDAAGVYGNPLLVPERTRTWDLGASWSARVARVPARASWAHYVTHAEHLILFLPAAAGIRALNLDQVRIEGDELEAALGGAQGPSATLAATWQNARDQSPSGPWRGKQVPDWPRVQLDARLAYARGAAGGYVDLFQLGRDFLDRYNRMPVPARSLWGAGVTLAMGSALSATLEGRNLGDVRATDVAGFPLPGRTLSIAFESRFPHVPQGGRTP